MSLWLFSRINCVSRAVHASLAERAQWLRIDAGYSTIRTRFIIISSREGEGSQKCTLIQSLRDQLSKMVLGERFIHKFCYFVTSLPGSSNAWHGSRSLRGDWRPCCLKIIVSVLLCANNITRRASGLPSMASPLLRESLLMEKSTLGVLLPPIVLHSLYTNPQTNLSIILFAMAEDQWGIMSTETNLVCCGCIGEWLRSSPFFRCIAPVWVLVCGRHKYTYAGGGR